MFDDGWPIGIPAPANWYRYSPGIEPGIYDPQTFGWYTEVTLSGYTLGEATPGVPVPAGYSNSEEDWPGVALPNGSTMEWRYFGSCCSVTVQATAAGTPAMARAAVLGAIPRLTYLANAS